MAYILKLVDSEDKVEEFRLTEIAFDNASGGDIIIKHGGRIFTYADAAFDQGDGKGELVYAEARPFQLLTEDGGGSYVFTEAE